MKVKLESFLQEVSEKTTENNQYPVLTSSKAGLYLQSDYFNKQVASKDNTGYKIIKRGQFTYRAMSDTGEFFPNMLDCADIGIVSPAYPVFEIAKPIVIPEFLKYYFKSNGFQQSIASFAQGSTRTSIKYGKLKTVLVELPDLKEQQRYVEILDTAQRIINDRKKELEKLDDLIKARFVEMFGDFESNSKQLEIETLGQLGFWSSGGTPSRTNPDYFTGDINWYSAGELNSLFLDESVEKITKEAINNSAAKLFKAGSMLVGMYDTAAFKMGILKEDSASNQACACIEPNERIDIVWLYYALTMMKNHYLSQRRGVRQKNLNLGMIKGFKLPIAQKNEQLTFVSFVKQIDKSKVAIQKALDETQLLFDSLMQKYFG